MKRLFVASSLLVGFATSMVKAGQTDAPLVPSSTTIAVLPVINMSGLKGQAETDIVKWSTDELDRQLAGRGFKLIEGPPVVDAIQRQGVDLTDEEQQIRSTLLGLGRSVGADLVAFVTIVDVRAETSGGFGLSESEGDAKVKCWLLDVKAARSLMSAKIESSHNRRNILGAFGGQVPRMAGACVTAIREAFQQALKSYPIKDTDRAEGVPHRSASSR